MWEARRMSKSELRVVVTAISPHTHTQHEVGSIPTDSESSWANQIINLQGLNYIASVHTYCHIRDTVSHTHSLLLLAVSPLFHTQTRTCTHTRDAETADIKQVNLNFGQVGKVLCMIWIKYISDPKKAQNPQLFEPTYAFIGDPAFSSLKISMNV